jgi:subtilase family serine protease
MVCIDFTKKKIRQLSVFINGTQVQYASTEKYLGMPLDAKLSGKSIIITTPIIVIIIIIIIGMAVLCEPWLS